MFLSDDDGSLQALLRALEHADKALGPVSDLALKSAVSKSDFAAVKRAQVAQARIKKALDNFN